MTYTGTLTHTYDDPALVLTATLDDGTLLHVLHDEDRVSPDEWTQPASLVLFGESARQYRIGKPQSLTMARDHARIYLSIWESTDAAWGCKRAADAYHSPTGWHRDGRPAYRHAPDVLTARYMRLFYGVEVRRVDLYGQGDFAEGYLVLDNLAQTHGDDYVLSEGEGRAILKSCAIEWQAYWAGEVYGFIHTTADGEELDSCWGFYLNEGHGPVEFAKSGAYGHVNGHVTEVEWA